MSVNNLLLCWLTIKRAIARAIFPIGWNALLFAQNYALFYDRREQSSATANTVFSTRTFPPLKGRLCPIGKWLSMLACATHKNASCKPAAITVFTGNHNWIFTECADNTAAPDTRLLILVNAILTLAAGSAVFRPHFPGAPSRRIPIGAL